MITDHIDRVGIELYSQWKEIQLGEIINVKHGYAFVGKNITEEPTKNILVTPGNFHIGGGFKSSKLKYYNSDFPPDYILQAGDIVITMTDLSQETDTLGYSAKVPKQDGINYLHNQRIGLVQFKSNGVNKDFIYWVMRTRKYQGFIVGSASGTSVMHTAPTRIKEYSFSLPPLNEQTAIADVLSSLDDKIDLLHRQNKTLEKLAETLFRQWFVEEAEEDWEETTLMMHTKVNRGLSYKGIGLTDKNLGLPMHNLNSVYEGGGYKYEGIKFYDGDYKQRHLASAGDIIVTNTEQGHELKLIGFPAIVPDCYGKKGLFSQHIYKLEPLENTFLTREFIYYLLTVPAVREQIIGATNGSTVNMLPIDGLQRPEFNLPPKEKVRHFTSIIRDYWTKKNVNQTQIRTLTQTRDTLLPKLMSGEVRVKMKSKRYEDNKN